MASSTNETQAGGHTPGPWLIIDGGICAATMPADGGNVICCEPEPAMPASLARWPANACLIHAAPDLLDAVQGALGALEQDHDAGKEQGDADWEGIAYERLEAARAAIAKALGK